MAPRSRHQKKALCFQTEYPQRGTLPVEGGGQECQQSVWGLEEATTERTAPPAGVEGDESESLHSDAYVHFFAMTDSVKNQPCFIRFFGLVFSSRELLHVVCRQPCIFSVHGGKLGDFSLNGHETLKCGAPYDGQN